MSETNKRDCSLDRVVDFVSSTEGLSLEEVKESLRASGIEPERVVSRYQEMMRRVRKQQRLERMTQARQSLAAKVEHLQSAVNQILDWPRDMVINEIKRLALLKPAQAFFREFRPDEMSDDELRDLLAQIQHGLSQQSEEDPA